jgi:histidine triad (HIT) family protein
MIADYPPTISGMCVFCRIVRGDVSAHIVFEDDVSLAFLDTRPLFPGHSLVVPREHLETLSDLPPELIGRFFSNVQLLGLGIEHATGAEGTFVAMNNRISQSVPHFHTHIVPRRRKDGLRGFFWPRTRYGDEAEMEQMASAIREAVRVVH